MVKRNKSLVIKTAVLWLFLCLAAGAPIVISAPNADVDLGITKTDSVDPVVAGEALAYLLSISNAGPAIATGVAITDTLPGGVTYTSASSGCVYNAGPRIVRCDLGSVGAGSVTSATIQVRVDPATTGSLLNQAAVTTLDTDTNASNNAAQATTTIASSADLMLSMTSPASAIAGDTITYTLAVSNTGPSDALGVVLRDDFPGGTSYSSSSIPCSVQGHHLTCTAGVVAAGTSTNVTITLLIDPGKTGAVTNDALVSATTPDPNATNNNATRTTSVVISSDITISKNGAPDPITPGELLTYMITTRNTGLSNGQGVTFSDTLPTQVSFQSYTATKGTCSGTTTVTCAPGSMTPGETVTVMLVGRVNPSASPGVITNTVSVLSTSPDPNLTNNSASDRTTIGVESADLQITKHDLSDPVRAGEALTYTITVRNMGPANASGVVVTDTLPISTTLSSISTSQGTCIETICTLGTLGVTSSTLITLTVTVDPSAIGVITNTVAVSANEIDLVIGNNRAYERTTIVQAADLSIEKTGTPEPVFAGRNLTYRLQISNHGPSRAEGVHVVDNLPAAVSFVSAPAGCIYISGSVDCNLGGLSANASRTITITTQVSLPANGLTSNTASISSITDDRIQANNQSVWRSTILAPDYELPTITWTQPVSDSQRYDVNCQMVHLQVNATDNLAVQWVYFYRWDPNILDYVDIGYDYTAPYGWDLDTCILAAKWNQIFAEARDTFGNASDPNPNDRTFIWLYRHIILFLPVISK